MRISDWSSDVCSSDLLDGELGPFDEVGEVGLEEGEVRVCRSGAVRSRPGNGNGLPKFGEQCLEQVDTVRIEWVPRRSRFADRASCFGLASSEDRKSVV